MLGEKEEMKKTQKEQKTFLKELEKQPIKKDKQVKSKNIYFFKYGYNFP